MIERAGCTRTGYLVHVDELTTAGRDTAVEAMLCQAENRLVRLRESRAVLVSDWLTSSAGEEGK